MAKHAFKVERIEKSEGLRLRRDDKGNVSRVKRKIYDKKNRKSVELDDEQGDVICESAPVQTIVLMPTDDRGPSDRLSLSTTDEELAKQFKVGKEYQLEFSQVGR